MVMLNNTWQFDEITYDRTQNKMLHITGKCIDRIIDTMTGI